jgi:hypothetical protein
MLNVSARPQQAEQVNGIAIVKYAPHSITTLGCKISRGWDYGQILRYDIRNGETVDSAVIYEPFDAHCPRINPSGTHVAFNTSSYDPTKFGGCKRPQIDQNCKGDIYILPVDGGEKRKLVSGVNCFSWLDFPMDDYVYYQSDYEGTKLWRVNTSGDPKPELLASNFGGPGASTSEGANYWSISSDGTRVAGFMQGALYAGKIGGGRISWNKLFGGCGGSVSPDGQVCTRNSGGHSGIFFHRFSDGAFLDKNFNEREKNEVPTLTVGMCQGSGDHWHRMHWPVNSSEWLIITQGAGYQTDQGSCATLLKADGSQCVQIGPLISDEKWKNAEHYQGSDFWFDYDPQPVSTRTANRPVSRRPHEVRVVATGKSLRILSAGRPAMAVSLLSPDGRVVARAQAEAGHNATLPRPARSGIYVVHASVGGQRVTRTVVVP